MGNFYTYFGYPSLAIILADVEKNPFHFGIWNGEDYPNLNKVENIVEIEFASKTKYLGPAFLGFNIGHELRNMSVQHTDFNSWKKK